MPDFFLHKWEIKGDKTELLIEIPLNVKDVISKMRFNPNLDV